MNKTKPTAADRKVVVFAATSEEADGLRRFLDGANIEVVVCPDPAELRARAESAEGCVLLTPGALGDRLESSRADSADLPASERELASRTNELAHLRTEFEHFATIVSHDLRSPLLSMTGCIELLSEQLRTTLDADGKELMGFVSAGANRLNEMIKGLLEFSRTGARPLEMVECPLDDVLAQVIAGFAPAIRQADGRITHDPLPVVWADCNLMSELFRHLIDNAIKFRGQSPLIVHIGLQDGPDARTISVTDNGIGVPPEHAERIFRVFQRLHGESSPYTGVGMGLAVCRKIVERHGGRIWVEPAAGEGSTLRFTLPKQPPA
jgi:light-regulated signal transduction histidine kinase (bacteriophytochrome)